MDIIIKSFNRPYYLERCLRSIHHYVKGNHQIVVLDDGTPAVYLEKIQKTFSNIKILLSDAHTEKSRALTDHLEGQKEYDNTRIPVDFWKRYIATGSDVFLLLEEDTWLTQRIDLNEVEYQMNTNGLVTVKLYWQGNPFIVKGKKIKISDDVEEILPELPVTSPFLLTPVFKNYFKIRSLLLRSGIIKTTNIVPYYALYTVASACFKKEYWLYMWSNAPQQVNEMLQLLNAIKWKALHKRSRYGKTKNEKLQTSFITSSFNTYRTIDFDFIRFNHILNQAWLKGELNAKENFNHDFSIDYLKQFILPGSTNNCNVKKWNQWMNTFKMEFEKTGAWLES